jgi:hypothetical protein
MARIEIYIRGGETDYAEVDDTPAAVEDFLSNLSDSVCRLCWSEIDRNKRNKFNGLFFEAAKNNPDWMTESHYANRIFPHGTGFAEKHAFNENGVYVTVDDLEQLGYNTLQEYKGHMSEEVISKIFLDSSVDGGECFVGVHLTPEQIKLVDDYLEGKSEDLREVLGKKIEGLDFEDDEEY